MRVKSLAIAGPHRILTGNRPLSLLLVGQTFSSLADWLLAVVLTVLVYDISHSGTTVSLLTFTRLAPYALVLPWSGIVLDRVDRRLLMAGLGVGRALCMLGLLLVHSRTTLPIAFPLVFVSASFSCVLRPTVNATIPGLVSEADTVSANSLVSLVDGVAHILGPALGGAFILLNQPRLALTIAAGAFLLSGAALFSARLPANSVYAGSSVDLTVGEILAGFRFVLRENERVLLALTVTAAGLALLAGGYYSLAVVLSTQSFHFGGQGVGWLDAVYGLGNFGGSVAVGALLRGRRVAHLFVMGAALSSLGVVFLAFSPPGPAPFLCIAVVGVASVVVQVTGTTILQAAAPREMLARVFTAFEAALVVATLVGALVVGPLLRLTGPRVATLCFACAGFALLLLSLPILRSLEEVLGLRVFLRGVPMLAGLSRSVLDELAPRFETGAVAAGDVIVREGEPGDRLYIIRRGEVQVSIDGHIVRKLGPAGYFGEIALLRSIPRTASVHASAPTEFYTLDRETFQALVQQASDLGPQLAHRLDTLYVYAVPSSPPRH
jgi:MFS family permease